MGTIGWFTVLIVFTDENWVIILVDTQKKALATFKKRNNMVENIGLRLQTKVIQYLVFEYHYFQTVSSQKTTLHLNVIEISLPHK